jgi:hypothetical protein
VDLGVIGLTARLFPILGGKGYVWIMAFVGYIWPFVVGAFFLWLAFLYFRKQKYKTSIIFGAIAALFVLAPFPWWVFFLFFALVALWYLRATLRFARNRNAVMKQTGEKWYRYACEEIFTERGHEFLQKHFAETLVPERVRSERQRSFAQTAALGVYLRLLEEKGKDATKYDTLPVDNEAVNHARVLSRLAIPSWLPKDRPPIFPGLSGG